MHPSGAETPRAHLLPTYQNRLRVIGRHLDLTGNGGLNLLEVPGGFLVRAMAPGARAPVALDFAHDGFPDLLADAFAARGEGERRHRPHPLLPTGYGDFLRALGFRLDKQRAEAITIAELEGFVAIGDLALVERYERTDIVPFQHLLRADEIGALLDETFRQRAQVVEVKREPRFWRR